MGDKDYKDESDDFDVKWLLDQLRLLSISVEYCPTVIILADFFTKPLQGTLFKTFRSVIMGHEDVSVLFKYRRIKERVEKM